MGGGRRREAGFSRWRELGEMGKHFTTLHNIFQWKKHKEAGTTLEGAGTGSTKYEMGSSGPPIPLSPCLPPHLHVNAIVGDI